jgi:hypothetical protein
VLLLLFLASVEDRVAMEAFVAEPIYPDGAEVEFASCRVLQEEGITVHIIIVVEVV